MIYSFPFVVILLTRSGEVSILLIFIASSFSLFGLIYIESGPPASSRHEPVAAITGMLECIASMIGMPKPSKKEGYTNSFAN